MADKAKTTTASDATAAATQQPVATATAAPNTGRVSARGDPSGRVSARGEGNVATSATGRTSGRTSARGRGGGPAKSVISAEVILTGKVTFGEGCIVHPGAQILAEGGDIIIGDFNIIEEYARIVNQPRKD